MTDANSARELPAPHRSKALVSALVIVTLSAILATAAALKFQQSWQAPTANHSSMLVAASFVEWSMASWVLSGVYSTAARRTLAVLLCVFTIVSGYHLLSGDSDCGCLGAIRVHPAFTFAFDLVALVAICMTPPLKPHSRRARGSFVVAGSLIFGAGPVIVALMLSRGVARPVVLNPQSWVGVPFPLSANIQTAPADFDNGEWTLILVDHNCSTCVRYVEQILGGAADRRVLLDIAPDVPSNRLGGRFPVLHLKSDVTYFAGEALPIEITMSGGLVTAVHPIGPVKGESE